MTSFKSLVKLLVYQRERWLAHTYLKGQSEPLFIFNSIVDLYHSQQKAKMDKHISLARELGYEGQELRDYLKRQHDLEREQRVAQREYEREKREADHKDKEREQKEKDRELEKLKN